MMIRRNVANSHTGIADAGYKDERISQRGHSKIAGNNSPLRVAFRSIFHPVLPTPLREPSPWPICLRGQRIRSPIPYRSPTTCERSSSIYRTRSSIGDRIRCPRKQIGQGDRLT